jgi:hypothetical protein
MPCKLVTQDLKTYADTQWRLGEWKSSSGEGSLCGSGWLHGYEDPLLAAFLNPVHANILSPLVFEVAVKGSLLDVYGTMFGATDMCLTQALSPLPTLTDWRCIRFALLCVLRTTESERFCEWAEKWLLGQDRTYDAAHRAACSESITWISDTEMPRGFVPAEVWAAEAATTVDSREARLCSAAAVVKAATVFGVVTKRSLNLVGLAKEAMS